MTEIWKDIEGFENYQVSDCGRVRSKNWNNTGSCRNLYLKPHNKGYLQVELRMGKTRKMLLVHRLVAQAFIPNPNGYAQINHIDEDKQNNNISNLEWCTQSQNLKAHYKNHSCKRSSAFFVRRKRVANPMRNTYKIQQLTLDGELIKLWDFAVDVKHQLNYNATSIWECCEGKRKTAYGYKWQYAISNINE